MGGGQSQPIKDMAIRKHYREEMFYTATDGVLVRTGRSQSIPYGPKTRSA